MAFELLGPPRLSKILYEAYLLKVIYGTFEGVLGTQIEEMSKALEKCLMEKTELKSQIISIGIPILLSKGDRLLRGSKIAIPADVPGKPDAQFEVSGANIERWAHDGWLDLRAQNMAQWQGRLQSILKEVKEIRQEDSSSSHPRDQHYWDHYNGNTPIEISKLASWILTNEEQGFRMKA